MTSVHSKLLKIQESEAFEELELLEETHSQEELTEKERLLFARLFLEQGRRALEDGKKNTLDFFQKAVKISEHSWEILFEQGLILYGKGDHFRCLQLAFESFCLATEKNPSHTGSWYWMARVLFDKGRAEQNHLAFHEADQAFKRLESLAVSDPSFNDHSDFYWRWGASLSLLGVSSGEPYDFQRAIAKFSKADSLGCKEPEFLRHYANACAELGALFESPDYFQNALVLFGKGLEVDPYNFDLLFDEACCVYCLADLKEDPLLWKKACERLEVLLAKQQDCLPIWLKLAQAQTIIGKMQSDQEYLKKALESYSRAYMLENSRVDILLAWASAELFLAGSSEDYEKIVSARFKIEEAIQRERENPDAWYLNGQSYLELMRYFNEIDFAEKAVESFKKGIEFGGKKHLFLYALGQAHYAIGELEEDIDALKESLNCFCQAEERDEGFSQHILYDSAMAFLKIAELTESPKEAAFAIEKLNLLMENVESVNDHQLKIEWLYTYGYALDLLGDLTDEIVYVEKAVEILEKIVQAAPNFYQARSAYANTLWHFGEEAHDAEMFRKSIQQFDILVQQDPEDALIFVDAGAALISFALLNQEMEESLEVVYFYFERAALFLKQGAALGNFSAYYQLACLYSLRKNYQFAFYFLEKAQASSCLPAKEDLLCDPWLEELRRHPRFRKFLASLRGDQNPPKRKKTE